MTSTSVQQERRRGRRFDFDWSASKSSPIFICCDVVKRMRDDITCICQDAKRLAKQKVELENRQKKFEAACSEVKQKLRTMLPLKMFNSINENLSEMKISETRDFLKYTWSLVNSALKKRAAERRFMSIRGVSVVDYVTDLVEKADTISADYGNEFYHEECSALFTHLTGQLVRLLAPEMVKADSIEVSLAYINYVMPSMINYINIINLYVESKRLIDLIGLSNELLYGSMSTTSKHCKTPAIRLLSSLLNGTLLGEEPIRNTLPVVEGRAEDFYKLASEVAYYILHTSKYTETVSPIVPPLLVGPGLIDSNLTKQLLVLVKKPLSPTPTVPQQYPVTPRPVPSRGRGRPRKRPIDQVDRMSNTVSTMSPISPSLSRQP